MKKINHHSYYILFMLAVALILASCNSGPSSPEPDEEEPVEETGVANTISQNLIFKESTVKAGTLPTNANLADLKIDKADINLLPGIKNRIRIQTNGNPIISSVLVHIPGSEQYHEVTPAIEEGSDSVLVFYIGINSNKLELPLDNSITIAPIDGNGDIIDEFKSDLHIDPPFDDEDFEPSGNTCEPPLGQHFLWSYTELNGEFMDARGYRRISNYETGGCCFNDVSSDCGGVRRPNVYLTVDNQWDEVSKELINFAVEPYPDLIIYVLERSFNDYDPDKTDFCSGKVGYSRRSKGIYTSGTYSMQPAPGLETFHEVTIESIDFTSQDLWDTGFGPLIAPNNDPNFSSYNNEYYLGCRFYIERKDSPGIDNPDGGGVMLRVFEIDNDDGVEWYD